MTPYHAIEALLTITILALVAACVARAPNGSTVLDLGTTLKALSCANADLSQASERRRCHVESGR